VGKQAGLTLFRSLLKLEEGQSMTTDERFDRIDGSIEILTKYVLDLRQETAARFQTIENRLDILSSTVANVDSRLPALTKAILDFGSLATQLVREQSGQKNSASDLVARVVKLEETVSRLAGHAA
jgi:SMC interacting uncharacterized protein involved in chromosome segregation